MDYSTNLQLRTLVVEGDPLSDVKVLTDPRKHLKLIMKDGFIYKDEL